MTAVQTNSYRVLTLIALCAGLGAPTTAANDEQVIDWTFKAGRLVTLRQQTVATATRTLGGKNTADLRYDIDLTLLHRTRSVSSEGLAKLELKPVRMRVDVAYGKTKASWSSDDPSLRKARSLPSLKPWVANYERKILITMDVPGRTVLDLQIVPANGATEVIATRTERLRDVIQGSRRLFPERPIRVGDSWPHRSLSLLYPGHIMVREGQRTLVGFVDLDGKRCAKIETKLTCSLIPEKEGESLAYSIEGTWNGVTLFELERGLIRSIESESNFVLTRTLWVKGQGEVVEVETRSTKTLTQATKIEDVRE